MTISNVRTRRREPWVWRVLLGAIMALTDLIVSVLWFTLTVVALSVSVSLLPVFLLGVPIFIGFARVTDLVGGLERRRIALFTGVIIEAPTTRPHGWRARLSAGQTWRAIAYSLLQFPLGVVTFTLVVSSWGLSLALISMPVWLHHTPSGHADGWFFTVTDTPTAWLLAGAGVLIAGVSVLLTVGLTRLEAAVARALLGVRQKDLERQVIDLQKSRSQVLDSVDSERRRIERDLHDGAQQRLVAVAMNLGRARARYDTDPAAAKLLIDEAHQDAKEALSELRDLARGIHPAVLTDRGLDAALSGLAGRSPIPVTIEVDVEPRCSATIDAIAYFVVSEALANAAKHSQATAINVAARRDANVLRLAIRDNGIGSADAARGSGLRGLRDRVGGVDGSLVVDSPPGGPTQVLVELPCE